MRSRTSLAVLGLVGLGLLLAVPTRSPAYWYWYEGVAYEGLAPAVYFYPPPATLVPAPPPVVSDDALGPPPFQVVFPTITYYYPPTVRVAPPPAVPDGRPGTGIRRAANEEAEDSAAAPAGPLVIDVLPPPSKGRAPRPNGK